MSWMKNKGERHAIGSFAGHSHLSQAVLQSPRCNMDKRTRDSFLLHFFPVEKGHETGILFGVRRLPMSSSSGGGRWARDPFTFSS